MEEKIVVNDLRREFGQSGWVLLVYNVLMSFCVMIICTAEAIIKFIASGLTADMNELMVNAILGNGWGYLVTVIIGALIMLYWKKGDFCFRQIWKTDRQMKPGAFFGILCIFVSGQAAFQIMAGVMESFFNLFGMSVLESVESASATADTFSMFLYITLLAPVSEEILFRGLILRTFEPYGKKFAILASAFLFGIFHGNIVQSPYAFLVGLVLGYTAVEYSIGWAMVLHMFNNLFLADMLTRISMFLPVVGELMLFLMIWAFPVAAVVIMIVKRREIAAYFQNGRIHPWCLKGFFTSPGVVVLTVYLAANMLLPLIAQIFS